MMCIYPLVFYSFIDLNGTTHINYHLNKSNIHMSELAQLLHVTQVNDGTQEQVLLKVLDFCFPNTLQKKKAMTKKSN